MKKYIGIIILLLFSCKKDNPYKKAYEQLVIEDVSFKQELRPFYRYNVDKEKNSKLNSVLKEFLEGSIKVENLQKFNELKQATLTEIEKLNTNDFRLENLIKRLNKTVTSNYEKLQCIDNVNFIRFRNLQFSTGCEKKLSNLGINSPITLFLSRVNDSLAVINISSKFLANNSMSDEDITLTGNSIPEDVISNKYYKRYGFNEDILNGYNQDIAFFDIQVLSYRLHSKSDTIRLKAEIDSKKQIGIKAIDFDKEIIVGKLNKLSSGKTFYKKLGEISERKKLNAFFLKEKQDIARTFALSLKNKLTVEHLMSDNWTLCYKGICAKNLKTNEIDKNIKLVDKKKSSVFNLKKQVADWKKYRTMNSEYQIIFIISSGGKDDIQLKINDNFKITEVSFIKG